MLKRPDLKTLRILTTYQGRTVPTVGGMLLFGTDRLGSFPDAWVKIGSFGGRDRSRILDSKEITSYLPMAVEEAMVQIGLMAATAIEIHGARHVARPAYPAAALREAGVIFLLFPSASTQLLPISSPTIRATSLPPR